MYSMNNGNASTSAHDFLAGKPFRNINSRRRNGTVDDEGVSQKRSRVGIKRAARERAMHDEAESDLRNARMGLSFDSDFGADDEQDTWGV